jgi:alpha-tubulin suppressor-like RCC1 family protein
LALDDTGAVWSWGGDNNYGELGNGVWGGNAIWNFAGPVVDSSGGSGLLSGIVAISAGLYHSLALKNDGTVWAWGANNYGQLGDGVGATGSNVPKQVCEVYSAGCTAYLTDVVSISSGGDHSLALKSDGTVWAWGNNGSGRLGDSTSVKKTVATQVVGSGGIGTTLSGITAITGGGSHSLALENDDSIWAWGQNWGGQLGNADCQSIYQSLTPQQVVPFGTVGNTDCANY